MTDRIIAELTERGERRHETCRFGRLTQAWIIEGGRETATLIPICDWSPARPHPPAIRRAWGGDVDFVRDSAVCDAHSPVSEGDTQLVAR